MWRDVPAVAVVGNQTHGLQVTLDDGGKELAAVLRPGIEADALTQLQRKYEVLGLQRLEVSDAAKSMCWRIGVADCPLPRDCPDAGRWRTGLALRHSACFHIRHP